MTTKHLLTHVRRRITLFDEAAQEYAFAGSYEPDHAAEVERNYYRAKRLLEAAVDRLATCNDRKGPEK